MADRTRSIARTARGETATVGLKGIDRMPAVCAETVVVIEAVTKSHTITWLA